MPNEVRFEGQDPWEALSALHDLDGVEIRLLEVPDATQLNNQLAETGALAFSLSFIILKLAPHAIEAVRDIVIKFIESRRAKVTIAIDGKTLEYEGPMNAALREKIHTDMKRIASDVPQ